MAGDLPEYYFRIRDNGAAVFRVDSENRQRRIEMEQIASVNVRNGDMKPHGDRKLSPRTRQRSATGWPHGWRCWRGAISTTSTGRWTT